MAHDECLKFILSGAKEDGHRVRNVSVECFSDNLEKKIGFSKQVSLKMAKYLIEQVNEDGKVEKLENVD